MEDQNKPEEFDPKKMELVAKLYGKIAAISKAFGVVKEDGRNKNTSSTYISHMQMSSKLRDYQAEHGLAVVPISPEVVEYNEVGTTTNNAKIFWAKVHMQFKVVDTETGYFEMFDFLGADQDHTGKAIGKAITECQKRFEFKFFHVSSSEEQDGDGNNGQYDKPGMTPQASRKPVLHSGTPEFDIVLAHIRAGSKSLADINSFYQASDEVILEVENTLMNEAKKNAES